MPDALPTDRRELRIGYFCAFAVLFVWAGFLLTARLSAAQAFTPWDVAALRYAGAFAAALPLAAVFGWPRLSPGRTAAIVGTAAFGFPLLAYKGFTFAPVAHAGVLMPGMLPLLTAALGVVMLAEAWTRRRGLSLLVVACGVGLLGFDTFGGHPGAWRGDLLFFTAAISWSVYTTLIRYWGIEALRATLAVALWAAPIYLPVWWLLLPSNVAAVPAGPVAFQLFYQGAVATVLAGFLFTRAVTALGAGRTTSITVLVPAMAALAAWPLLDEPLGMLGVAGVVLVSLGMALAIGGVGRR